MYENIYETWVQAGIVPLSHSTPKLMHWINSILHEPAVFLQNYPGHATGQK